MDYELEYVAETGDKKPELDSWQGDYTLGLLQWYSRFSKWLSARLEKAENFQLEIADWQDETFPKANALSKMSHLAKEIIELNKALLSFDHEEAVEDVSNELADCQYLLFGIASKCGINLYEATRKKFEINKKRKWGKPDSNGVVEHLH